MADAAVPDDENDVQTRAERFVAVTVGMLLGFALLNLHLRSAMQAAYAEIILPG